MKRVLSLLLFVVFILGLTGCGNKKQDKVEIKDWKDKYFSYLKNLEELNPIEIGKVGFVDSKISDDPIMYVEQKRTDEKTDNISLTYYYIKGDEVVFLGGPLFNEYPKVEFLYNSYKKEYAYYIIEKHKGLESYTLLESRLQSYAEYNNKEDLGQTYYDTNENGIIKLDNNTEKYKNEVFIDPNVEENFFKFTKNKSTFRKKLENYKKQNEFVTDEIKKTVEDKIKNTQENSKSVPEDLKQLETNTNNIKIGKYTLRYGKYRVCFNGASCSEFTLNQGGSAIFDGKSKYFRIDKHNFAQGVDEYQSGKNIYPAIIISDTKNGTGMNVYTPYATGSECLMTDGDLGCVNYIGE